jgi:hypothetical protein
MYIPFSSIIYWLYRVPGIFLGVKGDRHVQLTTSQPSMTRLSRKCRSLNILQAHKPPWSVTGTALPSTLQPCAGLGLLHGFVTVNFLGGGILSPTPNSKLLRPGLHFVWPLSFDLSGMVYPTRRLRSRQQAVRVIGGAQTSSP